MLPLMKEILLRTSTRFSSLPAERSSRTTTLSPRRTSSSTVLEPIKPAPPVTTYRIRAILRALSISRRTVVERGGNVSGFSKTRQNASGNLKQRSQENSSYDSVVYDENQRARFSKRSKPQERYEPPNCCSACRDFRCTLWRGCVCMVACGRPEQNRGSFQS